MPHSHPFSRALALAWPLSQWAGRRVLAAVSGGADSVALLCGLAAVRAGGDGWLAVGHYNHRIRPTADDDERFVATLCQRLGVELHVGRADAPGIRSSGDGLEAAARAARYDFLQDTAERLGARYVLTAHTADDQIETILHHLLRGTGVAGLAGMHRTRSLGPAVTLVRPMLGMRRADVRQYLADLGQPWREDATNQDRRLTRNRIRHELIPLLQAIDPAAAEAVLRVGTIAREMQTAFAALVEPCLHATLVERTADRAALKCAPLADLPRHAVREVCVLLWRQQNWPRQQMGYAQWDQLADLVQAVPCEGNVPHGTAAASLQLPGGIHARREGPLLVVARSPASAR